MTKPRYTNPPIYTLISKNPNTIIISTHPFKHLLILNTTIKIYSTYFTISTTISFNSTHTFSYNTTKPSSIQTKPPLTSINLSTPQKIQSSINSNTLPYKLKYNPNLTLFNNFSYKYLIDEKIFNNNKQQKPFHITYFYSNKLSNNLIATLSHSSTNTNHTFTL